MSGMNAQTGAYLANTEHVAQSVTDILTTPLNSRVGRRDYGSAIPDLIDQPLNRSTLLKLYAASATALIKWEPRLTLTGFTLEITTGGKVTMGITGDINGSAWGTAVTLNKGAAA